MFSLRSDMVQRKRLFTELDRKALLRALGDARRACIQAQIAAPIGGPEFKAADGVINTIDDAAFVLTGSREAYWARAHGTADDGTPLIGPGDFTRHDRAQVLQVLVDEMYLSAEGASDQEALLGPVADRIIGVLEGKAV